MKYQAIKNWADEKQCPAGFMCRMLGVARPGYHAWRNAPESRHALAGRKLSALIGVLWRGLNRPGVRRLHAEPRARGPRVSRKRVWRLMRAQGTQGRHPRAWRRTTIADKPANAPDLLGRDFTATAPDTRWAGDVTYVKTWTGWACMATVIDLYSRKLVGWAIADNMRAQLVIDALDMAVTARHPAGKVIFHSDRGSPVHIRRFRGMVPQAQCPPFIGQDRCLFR